MEAHDFAKQIVDFNKNAAKIGFDTISAFSGQAAKLTDSLIGIVPNVPEEGEKAADLLFKEQQKALTKLQVYFEEQLDVDWTGQDAPAKSIEALEGFCKQVFNQSDVIKNESKTLVDKATEQLPEEAKPLVTLWSDAITNGFSLFQDSISKSLELSKQLLNETEVKAAKTKTSAKS